MKVNLNIFRMVFFCLFFFIILNENNGQNIVNKDFENVFEIQKQAESASKIWSGDSYRYSLHLFGKAHEEWMKLGKTDRATDCLRESANLLIILSENSKASILLKKSLEIDQNHNNLLGKSNTLSLLGHLYLIEGKNLTEKTIDSAIEYSKISKNPLALSKSLSVKADFQYAQSSIEESIKSYLQALDYAKQSGEIRQIAQIQFDLSYAYIKKGSFDVATQTAQSSLDLWKQINDARGIAFAHLALGFALRLSGKEQEAVTNYLIAEKLFPNDLDYIEHGRLLASIAFIHSNFGKDDLLERKITEAYNFYKKANYLNGQLAILPELVSISLTQNKKKEAKNYLKEIKKLSIILKNNFFLGHTKMFLGDDKLKNNFPSEAIKYYQSTLSIYEKTANEEGIAMIHSRIGNAFKIVKLYDKSRSSFEKSLEIGGKTKNKTIQSTTLFDLAKLAQVENNPDEALKNITESLNLTENLYSDVTNSNLQRSYFSNVYERYEFYIHLLMQKHKESPTQDFAIQALQASEKSRSRSLLETLRLSEANFTKDANPELLAKEKEILILLNSKKTKLIDLLSNDGEKSEINKIDDEIRSLENEIENIKAELKQKSPVYSAIKNPPPFDVAEFQKNVLDEKTVLLEFSLGERESYLWLVSKNEVTSYILPPRNIIEEKVNKIHQSFEKRQPKPNEEIEVYQQRLSEAETEFKQESKLLSHDLLSQVIDKIKDKRLIVVPDGKLAILPLSTLNVPNTETPLILQNEIVYEPSASLLNILANLRVQKKMPTKDLLVFADPVFSETDSRLNLKHQSTDTNNPSILDINLRDFRLMDENGRIPRLFATKNEADSIANVIGESSSSIASGFDANRERVTNSDINDYRILHFATHGLIDVKRPEISSIVLSQFDEDGNKREGFLRLQDIYALDLATDLVVLSACQSGVGKEIKGEGLMSLNNAFLQAGAKSVLSSAWKVDDSATAELMKYFYENLSRKQMPPGQALREAQIKQQQNPQFSSPFYWAAFTIQGEFKQPISIKQQTHYFYYFAFTVLIILFGGLGWKFRKKLSYRT